jgi:hypothetical protein
MVACLAALATASLVPAQDAKDVGKGEIRFFVLDKNGSPVDVHGWTGAVEVTPEHGTARTIKLEQAAPASGKEHSRAYESPAPEHYSNSQDYSSQHSADGVQADGQTPTAKKDLLMCGEARKLDDYWVEMVVVWPKTMMEKAKEAYEKGGEKAKEAIEKGKQALEQGKWQGFMHDHGVAYFRAPLDPSMVKDTKTNAVNFGARVTFTTPNGDTKYVKGYTYPAGFIDGAFGHVIDKDFYDTSKFDHEQATKIAHKVRWGLFSMPPLYFSSDKDRQEYEKARQDCVACTQRLEQATGKDITKAADDCKSALKEVRSQAADAQGVLAE